jgi:alkylation response protein AidB-like acyl-CoA dehydrogenase
MPWPATPSAPTASAPAPLTDDVHDVLSPAGGTGPEAAAAGLVSAAHRLAEDLLAPAAEATDRAPAVPLSHLDALAGAGLFDLTTTPKPATRAIYEALAGACGVTFFVWVQHHAPVRMLAASTNAGARDRWLDDLRSGRLLGGVAFAYLRRPGTPAVVATRVSGGYRIDGKAPWVTSWSLAGLYAVAARLDDQVLFFLMEAQAGGVRASPPLAMAAMNASSTVRLAFEGLFVADDDVLSVSSFAGWQADDRVATAQANPAPFGIAARCVRLLGDTPLAGEVADLRARAYAGTSDLAAQVDLRAESLELAVRCATALVVASGGRGMSLDHPAQRLLREAAFFTILAQTPALRQATLAQLAPRTS